MLADFFESVINFFVDLFFEDGSLTFFGSLIVFIPFGILFFTLTRMILDFTSFSTKSNISTVDSDVVGESTSDVVDLEEREYTKKLPKYNRK